MNKRWIAVPLLVAAASLFIWYGLTFPSALQSFLQKVDLFFRWISLENPLILFLLGALVITFVLLFWRSRGGKTVEI